MLEAFQTYLQQVFGIKPEVSVVTERQGLPVLYTAAFQFFRGTLRGQPCVFAIDRGKMRFTPAKLRKHMAFLTDHFFMPVVYVNKLSGVHDAQRLIAQQIPFIVPGKHLYLPFIATILSPAKKMPMVNREYLCLCAQLILTGVLLKRLATPVAIAEATAHLPFSRTAVIAALDELEYFGLGHKEKLSAGREIAFQFTLSGESLWNESQSILRNPCKRTVGVNELPDGCNAVAAGADALAQVTMLSEISPATFAMELARFRKMDCETVLPDMAEKKLQLWLYPPTIFGKDKIDPLSLALSLRNEPDDRIQIALEEFMKGFPW